MSGSVREAAQAVNKGRNAGYTIIESAIVMAVVGIMMASFATAYNIYLKTQAEQKTDNNASVVVNGLDNYLIQTGAYPCPARSNAVRADADYGVAGDCTSTAVAVGNCSNGICVETSNRAGPALAAPRVRRGMVPFRTLGIAEEYAEDGYKTRFDYAVTEALAVPSTYNQKNGGIDLQDGAGTSLVKPPSGTGGSVHYVLIGKGPDRLGGYTRYGQQTSACPTGTLDNDNCNTGLVSSANLAIYKAAAYSTANGATHFDDYVKYSSSVETPLWKVADAGGFHINDLINAGPGGGKIAIGKNPDALTPALEVAGKVHASLDSHANELCPSGSSTVGCFPVAHSLNCPSGQYATGIDNGVVRCSPQLAISCPSGQVARGLAANGTVNCQTVVNCPVQNKTVCSGTPAQTTYVLPAGYQGNTWTTPVTGYSFQRTYVCGSGGNWQTQSSTGVCDCNPVDEYYDVTCNSQMSGNWSGTITVHHVHICPANTDTYTNTASSCTCVPTTETSTGSCPSGYSGSVTYQRNWTCSSASAGSWSSWTQTASTCVCSPTTETQNFSCQAGYSGTITQQRSFTCPAATWTSWATTANTCTCTGATQYQTIGCVAPLTGSRDQVRNYNCGTDSWGPWTTYQDNCGTVVYTWRDVSSQTGPFGSALPVSKGNTCSTQGATSACSSAAGGGQYWHYDTCECQ
jgi:type II secretory pathway pseudopilin PulG